MEAGVITMRNVYERFGRASETAQPYEYGLATIWLYLEYFGKGWWQKAPSPDALSSLQKTMERKTLGQLLAKVRGLSWFENGGANDQFEDHLGEALEARHFLMHEFFKTDAGTMETDKWRHQKLLELERYQEALDRGMDIASRLLNALVKLRSDFLDPER